jgi:hypothetical protein
MLLKQFDEATTQEKKLAIAEELAFFDGGELAREVRISINRQALK